MELSTAQMPVSLLGEEYLAGLTVQERRQNGQVYTPPHVVDFVLAQAGYAADPRGPLLDPACGAGAFLEGAVRVLARNVFGGDTRPQSFLERVETELFGIDVDEHACGLATEAVRRTVQALVPGPLPPGYFARNVRRADFLTPEGLDGLPAPFAFVVGNPPYVSATRIHAAQKAELRRRFATASGRLDLYTLFIERAVGALAEDGRAALITPDKYLVSQSARSLRGFLADRGVLRSIARFRSHRVFASAATVPCVTVFDRTAGAPDVEVLACDDAPAPSPRIEVRERALVPRSSLTSAPWYLSTAGALPLARRLQAGRPRVADVTVRVSAGPATGRDGVFVMPRGSEPEIEPELLRPAVRGRDVDAYAIRDPQLDILLPYTFDVAGEAQLIDLRRFAGAARYLARHREVLGARHCVRVWEKRWYDLHDHPACDLASQPKILVPDVADSNRFAVDRGRFFPLHSAYYLLPRERADLEFLVGLLNSTVAAFFVRVFSPVVKDGFNRYRQQFLHEIPIPATTADERAAIALAARDRDAATVDRHVERLFGLSDEDLRIMGRVVDRAS